LNLIPLILYAAAGVVYAIHFARRQPGIGRAATTLLLFAALSHTFVIGMQTMEVRHVPFANVSRLVSSFVWVLALSYIYLEVTTDERAMGVFILPILVGLQMIPVLNPGVEKADPLLDSPWFWVHIASLLFAYASFALAAMLGLTYVLQFKEIKKKQLGYFYTRLPSLQVLDTMNQRASALGWVFLTMGLIVGAIWAGQASSYAGSDPRVQAMQLQDPKIFVALVCWAVYSFEVFAARRIGWGGRRTAYLSAIGFTIVLLNFIPISYFLTSSHNF